MKRSLADTMYDMLMTQAEARGPVRPDMKLAIKRTVRAWSEATMHGKTRAFDGLGGTLESPDECELIALVSMQHQMHGSRILQSRFAIAYVALRDRLRALGLEIVEGRWVAIGAE